MIVFAPNRQTNLLRFTQRLALVLWISLLMVMGAFPSPSNAQNGAEDFGYTVHGKRIPTYEGARNLKRAPTGRPGVFQGNFVGCKKRADILAYNQAKAANDQKLMSRIKTRGQCVQLAGRTYRPLVVGFDTSAVVLSGGRSNAVTWVMTIALVASPPPPRRSFFQY